MVVGVQLLRRERKENSLSASGKQAIKSGLGMWGHQWSEAFAARSLLTEGVQQFLMYPTESAVGHDRNYVA